MLKSFKFIFEKLVVSGLFWVLVVKPSTVWNYYSAVTCVFEGLGKGKPVAKRFWSVLKSFILILFTSVWTCGVFEATVTGFGWFIVVNKFCIVLKSSKEGFSF